MCLEVSVWVAGRTWGSPLKRFVALTIADSVSPYNDCILTLEHISEATEIPIDLLKETLLALQEDGSLCMTATNQHGRYEMIFPECEDLCNPLHPPSEKRVFKARLVEAFDRQCVHCQRIGTDLAGPDGRTWTADRIVPGSAGGTYRISNVALSCFTCNVRRGNRILNHAVESLEDREKGREPWRGRRCWATRSKIKPIRRPRERRLDLLKISP